MATPDAFASDLGVYRMLGDRADARPWLDALPDLVAAVERDWDVITGSPWADGHSGWAAPAVTADGRDVVVKLVWPHDEAAGEAAALDHWSGHGAVRVLRHDPQRWALLLDRCRPGTALRDHDAPVGERLAVAAQVLTRLWEVAPPAPALPSELVPNLAEVVARQAALATQRLAAAGARHDLGVARVGIELLATLGTETSRGVLLHGDFNPGNVLLDGRHGWLAIDPKPLCGDPAYDPYPLLTQLGDPFAATDPAGHVARQAAAFAELTGLSAERLLAWSLARAVESGLWEDAHGRNAAATETLRRARILAGLVG